MITVREKVRFVETDMMGVAHHSNHFRWFEMGRVEYLRQAGISLIDLMNEGIVFPITHVECQYRASAKFDDYILIETTMTEVSPVKMVFTYRIIRENDGVLLAAGKTINVFATSQGKIVRLPGVYFNKLKMAFENKENQCI